MPSTIKTLSLFGILWVSAGITAQSFWRHTPSSPGGPKTAIVALSDSILIVGTTEGILRSSDQGYGFDTILPEVFVYSLFYSEAGVLFAGGEGRIYRSATGGDTWDTIVLNEPYPVHGFTENSQGDLFAITGIFDSIAGFLGAGVYYSADGGITWAQRNNGLTSTRSCDALAIDKNGRSYLGIADNDQLGDAGLFYSDNNGLQWHHVNVAIDGRGVIPDQLRIYTISGISISPQDSVYISIDGAAVNIGVNLNLHKSIHDIGNPSFWKVTDIGGNINWWNDRQLFHIHFAQNGDWYSSTTGSVNLGFTWFSKDKGLTWNKHNEGLDFDFLGRRNIQYFSETPSGRIYMVQRFAGLIHYTDTSVITTSTRELSGTPQGIEISPNPTVRGTGIYVSSKEIPPPFYLYITDIQGTVLAKKYVQEKNTPVQLPYPPGIYMVYIEKGIKKASGKIVIN